MKRKLLLGLVAVGMLTACGKTVEKTKTIQVASFNLEMEVPESWSVTKETEYSAEISKGGKGDTRLFYIKPMDADSGAVTLELMKEAVVKKAGYTLKEEIQLKNGIGIRYEDKPGKKVNKKYWFIIQAKGKNWSVERGIYNNTTKYYDLEKAAIESIR
jgi:hypothetical protein